jgi:hypothetical protein
MERNSAHLLLAHRTERAAAVRNTLVASLSSEEKKRVGGPGSFVKDSQRHIPIRPSLHMLLQCTVHQCRRQGVAGAWSRYGKMFYIMHLYLRTNFY